VDAFNWENFGPVDLSGKVVNQTSNIYFSINPDEAAGAVGASAADIYVQTPAGWALFSAAGNLGLDLFGLNTDDVDALIMWDKGIEGELNPGVDYALFSLSPGSASLGNWNLSAADVFFTDFTGVFATYATAADLGLIGVGGSGLGDDNVDALEIVPEPLTMLGVFLGVSGLAGYLKRRLA